MNRSRLLIPATSACLLALSLAPVQAQQQQPLTTAQTQQFRSLRQSFQTTGALSWGGQTQNIRRMRIELDEDGDARLKFDSADRAWNWGWREGDWSNWDKSLEIDGVWLRDPRGIVVDLRSGLNGQTVVGTARFTLGEGFVTSRITGFTLNGRVVHRPWESVDLAGNFDFGGWNGGGGTNNRLDELTTIKRGSGGYSDGTYESTLTRANVELKRDGTAKITLSGNRDWIFEGRWRQTGPDRIELRLDTFGSQEGRRLFDVPRDVPDSIGGGEIIINGTRVVSIRLRGTAGDHDFDAYFEPKVVVVDNGPWNGNVDNNGPWDGGDNGGWTNGPWNNGPWNGGNNGPWTGGGRGGGRGNGNGGWNGGNNGGWGGNGNGNGNGNGPNPNPRPQTGNNDNLRDKWKGWTGEGRDNKGTLPPPPPQPTNGGGGRGRDKDNDKGRDKDEPKGNRPAPRPEEPKSGPVRNGHPGTPPVEPAPPRNTPPAPAPVVAPAPAPAPAPPREEPRNTQPAPPPVPSRPREAPKRELPAPPPVPVQPREEPRNTQPAPPPVPVQPREEPKPREEPRRREEPKPREEPRPREEPKREQPAPPPAPAPAKNNDDNGGNKNKGDDNDRPRSRVGKPR